MNKLIIIASLVLSGCATMDNNGMPPDAAVFDLKGKDIAQYRIDHAECGDYMKAANVGDSAVGGAIVGSVIMGAAAAFLGNRHDVGQWAGTGAVVGSASAAGGAMERRKRIFVNCMAGRGYTYLG